MNIKDLIKKKGFWVAASAAVVIILQLFGVKADAPYVNEVLSGICAMLVAVGLMTTVEKKEIENELKASEKIIKEEKPETTDKNEDEKK